MNVETGYRGITVDMPVSTAKALLTLMDHTVLDRGSLSEPVADGYAVVRDTLQERLARALGVSVHSIDDMSAMYKQVHEFLTEGALEL